MATELNCTCGAFKVYKAKPRDTAHSDWCDVSAKSIDTRNAEPADCASQGVVYPPFRKHYCKLYCNTLQPATKIVKGQFAGATACCDSCATLAKVWGITTQVWDISDPNAPTVP